MRDLFYNQLEAFERLKKYKVGALFMNAGSGKTLSAVTLINSRNDISKVLWLTPFRTKENLKDEINKCNLKKDIEIVGIETLSNSDKTYLKLLKDYNNIDFFMVVDESLKIKNDSKRAIRIINIGKKAKYKLILNGTPISKNYLDLYNQMEFLSPKILNMSYKQFYNTFVVEKFLVNKKGKILSSWIDGYTNLEYLFNLIKPFIYKSDLILKVALIEYKYNFILTDDTLEEYIECKNGLLKSLENQSYILQWFQKLQISYSVDENKMKLLKSLLIKLNERNRKIIIFYKYIKEYELLKELPYKILSLQKHAFGLNLQEYNTIIFFNKSWDYAVMTQAINRIYRKGQKEDCEIYYINASVGFENMIIKNLEKKENLLISLKNMTIEQIEKGL